MDLKQKISNSMLFEGMTTVAGLALMDIFVGKALENHSVGSFLEFGTYKGRTAALLAQNLTDYRWLHAVEQSDYLEIDRIKTFSDRVTWHKKRSEAFCADDLPSIAAEYPVIATHHDASHFFDNVYTEITNVSNYLLPRGIMILDDFNDPFSQVRAAYYFLRYANSFPYELLLIGFNKCILVHDSAFDYYESFVLDKLLGVLRSYGLSCMLYRTDIHKKSKAFYVAAKRDPSEPDHYGERWCAGFYKPAATVLK